MEAFQLGPRGEAGQASFVVLQEIVEAFQPGPRGEAGRPVMQVTETSVGQVA